MKELKRIKLKNKERDGFWVGLSMYLKIVLVIGGIIAALVFAMSQAVS
jgi:hypothetical protein